MTGMTKVIAGKRHVSGINAEIHLILRDSRFEGTLETSRPGRAEVDGARQRFPSNYAVYVVRLEKDVEKFGVASKRPIV